MSSTAKASITPAAKPKAAPSKRLAFRGAHMVIRPPTAVAPPATTDQAKAAKTRPAWSGSCAAQSSVMRNPSNRPHASVVYDATSSDEADSNPSGIISPMTTDIMQPAAKPRHSGWSGAYRLQNRNAGAAARSCGADVRTAHHVARPGPTPLATKARATPKPSGMLCAPMAVATRAPLRTPEASPAAAHATKRAARVGAEKGEG